MHKKNFFLVEDFENINEKEYRKRTVNSHIFHSLEWMRIVKETFGINYKVASLKENNMTLASIPFVSYLNLIKGPCALPIQFSGYHGSIVSDNDKTKSKLLGQFFKYCEKKKLYTQLPEINLIEGHQSFSGYSIYIMDINQNSSVEEQVLSFSSKRMSNYIKQALKSELISKVGGLELLDMFYLLYLQNMKELGTPPFSKKYFKKIIEYLPHLAKIILVQDKRKKICSSMFVLKVSEKELFARAICTPRLYKTEQSSHLIYLEAIRLAKNLGCSVMNFGRSIDGSGPALFKKRYGLKATPQLIYSPDKKWTVTDPNQSILRYAVNIWKILPIPLTKVGGIMFAKHVI